MKGTMSLEQWELAVLQYATMSALHSKTIGAYFMAGLGTF